MASVDLAVPARARIAHRVDLSSPGVVKWEVRVQDFDCGVEITWQPLGSTDVKQVMPMLRLTKESSSVVCLQRGTLEFTFDNAFSMLRSKIVLLSLSKTAIDEEAKRAAASYDLDVASGSAALNALAIHGITLYFTNRFTASERAFQYDRTRVPVYALSWATIAWTRALLTLEPGAIEEARGRLAFTQSLCETYMPSDNSLLSNIKSSLGGGGGGDTTVALGAKPDTAALAAALAASGGAPSGSPSEKALTPLQLEAQLLYAEATLLSSLLFLVEESVLSLLKCGMAVRSGWRLYQQVDKQLGGRVSSMSAGPALGPGTVLRMSDAVGGEGEGHAVLIDSLAFGIGVFSTLASILPAAVLKVLSALGLPADREAGMAQLRLVIAGGRVRAPLAALMLLAMRVLLPSFHKGDVGGVGGGEADAILAAMEAAFPNSALFTWMGGRLARMRGEEEKAEALFLQCAREGAAEMPQLVHLSLYERAWVSAFRLRWRGVGPLHAELEVGSSWSKAYYSYCQAVAALQGGRVVEARGHFVSTLRYGAGARKLGGRTIPAEQYAVRRAAEFVAFTRLAGQEEGGEEARLFTAPPSHDGSPLVRLLLPATVAVGSPAHVRLLAFPATLPGLESIYFFNGFPAMAPASLHASIREVDSVLRAIVGGRVFDAAAWAGVGGEGAPSSSPSDASDVLTPAELTALLDAAAGVTVTGLNTSPTREGSASRSSDGPAPSPASPSPASRLGGLLGKSVGGLVSSVSSKVTSAASTVASVAGGVKSGVSSVAGMAAGVAGTAVGAALTRVGVSTGPSPSSAYAIATPTTPIHATAIAALMRGSACAGLGRVGEAAAAFAWVYAAGEGGRLRRDAHLPAYAAYENGLLYLDAARVLGGGSEGGATGGRLSTREAAMAASLPSSAWVRDKGMTAASARAECVRAMGRARAVAGDYNWKVRLSIRVHLAFDELRAMGAEEEEPGGAAEAAAKVELSAPGEEEAEREEAEALAAAAAAEE
jgi:hypothetical protein